MNLQHHGVQGQKWGVRNGPPYPIQDKVLRKGSRLSSVMAIDGKSRKIKDPNKLKKWLYTYNPDDEWDRTVYRGPFAYYLYRYRGQKTLASINFRVKKDLRMPTKEERIDEFRNLMDNKFRKRKIVEELKQIRSTAIAHEVGGPETVKKYERFNPDVIQTKEDWDTAYELFNHLMESAHRHYSTQKYMKEISKKYDAMVDDNNQGLYNEAHDPVIIFRVQEALEKFGDMEILTTEEMMNNLDKIDDVLWKKGKYVSI